MDVGWHVSMDEGQRVGVEVDYWTDYDTHLV